MKLINLLKLFSVSIVVFITSFTLFPKMPAAEDSVRHIHLDLKKNSSYKSRVLIEEIADFGGSKVAQSLLFTLEEQIDNTGLLTIKCIDFSGEITLPGGSILKDKESPLLAPFYAAIGEIATFSVESNGRVNAQDSSALSSMIGGSLLLLPNRPISLGSSWKGVLPLSSGSTLIGTWRLCDRQGDIAHISSKGKLCSDLSYPAESTEDEIFLPDLKGQHEGIFEFNEKAGRVQKAKIFEESYRTIRNLKSNEELKLHLKSTTHYTTYQ